MQQDRMYVNVTSAEFQEILDFPMENTNECQTFVSGWLAELQAKNGGTFDLLRARQGIQTEIRVMPEPTEIQFTTTVERHEEEQGKGSTIQ